ncbi:holin [Mycobacterium phage Phreeze]|nr:holin [Mycobacterium phage Phreeze]
MANVLQFPKPNPVTDTVPAPGLRLTNGTAPDLRQFVHGLVMVWVPVLAVLGVASEETVLYWVGLGLGAFDALVLAFPNTADKLRAVTYAFGALVQAALIAFGVLTETQITILIGAAVSSVVSFIAFRYTPSAVIEAPAPEGRFTAHTLGKDAT